MLCCVPLHGRALLLADVDLRLYSVVLCATAVTCTTTGCCGSEAAQCCVVCHCMDVLYYWLMWILGCTVLCCVPLQGCAPLLAVVDLRLHSAVLCVTAGTCSTTGCCGSYIRQIILVLAIRCCGSQPQPPYLS